MSFEAGAAKQFVCERADFDESASELTLRYRLEPGPSFVERIVFPNATRAPGPGFEVAVRWLHLAAGVSYYKLAMCGSLKLEESLTTAEAEFFKVFYQEGLAELGYRNGLDLPVKLEISGTSAKDKITAPLDEGVVVPVGGGKDSLVTVDLLTQARRGFRTLAVGRAPLIRRVVQRVGQPHIAIQRMIDPHLAAYVAAGGYNGHVPITGVLAFVKLCGAFLYGYDTVLMSNERSANEPTLTTLAGVEVNHQYSKSTRFEVEFGRLIHSRLDSNFQYFSLLRPLSELAIAQRFASTHDYDDVFSSCNANFGQAGQDADQRWCGNCPKCRFVYLALALFIEPARLHDIFGADLLDDPAQLSGFAALLSLADHKPFECVGEVAESRAAVAELGSRSAWRDKAVIRSLLEDSAWDAEAHRLQPLLQAGSMAALPSDYRALLELP